MTDVHFERFSPFQSAVLRAARMSSFTSRLSSALQPQQQPSPSASQSQQQQQQQNPQQQSSTAAATTSRQPKVDRPLLSGLLSSRKNVETIPQVCFNRLLNPACLTHPQTGLIEFPDISTVGNGAVHAETSLWHPRVGR